MEEGFLKDEGYGVTHPGKWVEGRVEDSFWTGIKTSGRKQVQVMTYRCTACGFLESYAK